ncbi:MAG: acyl carrier protein [Campylobacterales bacterium]|nr:acyl carrier protein [Campylobacterales bacterium]
MELDALKQELKVLMIEACEKEVTPEEVEDEAPLFGMEGALQLDSIDALQVSMALSERYGIEVTDSKKMRAIMVSVQTLAEYVYKERKR